MLLTPRVPGTLHLFERPVEWHICKHFGLVLANPLRKGDNVNLRISQNEYSATQKSVVAHPLLVIDAVDTQNILILSTQTHRVSSISTGAKRIVSIHSMGRIRQAWSQGK